MKQTNPFPVTLAGVLGAWGPSLAGIIVTAAMDGKAGLRWSRMG